MKPNYGVIVGRFQVNALHDGHKDLFDQVFARHNRVIVFVGVSPAGMTKDHPLDFATREAMLKAAYPTLIVQPLEDARSDKIWSEKLDNKIDEIVKYGAVTLYGGRDSFVPHYHGQHKPVELALDPRKHKISGTDIRMEISNTIIASPDFRAGVIYAMNQLWPHTLPMVDVAILSYDRTEVLLAQKPGENQWRFIGGHVEARKGSVEHNARLEALEEATVDLIDQEYIGSAVIDDWRYRLEDRSVVTSFFAGRVSNMCVKANDDVSAVSWFHLDKLTTFQVVEEHVPLLMMLHQYLKEKNNARTVSPERTIEV